MYYKSLILLGLLTIGCPKSEVIKPIKNGEVPVIDTDWCSKAQDTLKSLECKNPDNSLMWKNLSGEEFKDTCVRLQQEGGIYLDPRCIAESTTCQKAKACPPS